MYLMESAEDVLERMCIKRINALENSSATTNTLKW